MMLDFPLILTCLTVFTGVVALVDWAWQIVAYGKVKREKIPTVIDYCRSFFPIFFIVLVLRSFLFQPFRVPTGSLEPTVMPGDFILVKQYPYGVKMPVWNNTIIKTGHPKRGDIALFTYPVNPKLTFVKRVVGIPGDRISYINKVFYINGKEMKQSFIKNTLDKEPTGDIKVKEYSENLMGIKHNIIINDAKPDHDFHNLIVPKGQYLMVGDNRDDSDDSRYWGVVPEKNFVGQALFVWMNVDTQQSWNLSKWHFNWHRIGTDLVAQKIKGNLAQQKKSVPTNINTPVASPKKST